MPKEAIEKQQKILEFVTSYMEENGYPPSIREICKGVGLSSTSTVHAHLETLKRKGLLEKADSKSRGLRVKKHDVTVEGEFVNIPLVQLLPVRRFWLLKILKEHFRFLRILLEMLLVLC